jgi:arginase
MSHSRVSDPVDGEVSIPTTTKTMPTAGTVTPPSTTGCNSPRFFGKLNTSMIESKFLTHPEDLGVVAVGFSGGQGKPGVDAAPTALIESGLLDQLRDELGYNLHGHDTVHSYSDLHPAQDPPHRGMKNPRAVSAVTRRIAEQVYDQAKEGRLVLTLGGDHSVAIGTIAGSAKAVRERLGREIAVIWVDAHADINTPETSGSGNIHGMPVSFLTGLAKEEREEFFGWLKDEHRISVKKLVYIGLRDVDAGEKRILRENGIKAFSMFDIDRCVSWLFFPLPPKRNNSQANVKQARDRSRHGDGAGAYRQRHPHPPVLRCRRSRPHVGSFDRHTCAWWLDAPRG